MIPSRNPGGFLGADHGVLRPGLSEVAAYANVLPHRLQTAGIAQNDSILLASLGKVVSTNLYKSVFKSILYLNSQPSGMKAILVDFWSYFNVGLVRSVGISL